MAIPRREIVQPQFCRYYHIVGRCVRRTFLCGKDNATGRDYEHRRAWVIERLETLSQAFSIDVAGYAIMANHYHLVVHLNPGVNDRWSEDEVIARWSRLYSLPQWVREVREGGSSQDRMAAYQTWLEKRRAHLGDLSWFMKCLNEPIAKRANREDGCTGSFWEGRFKSQALMNEKALLACLSYVDLNPIRAKLATTPETSEYTSIRQRIRALIGRPAETQLSLLPFIDDAPPDQDRRCEIPCTFTAYLELVETTGRVLAQGKRGAIPASAAPVLQRLGFDASRWLKAVRSFEEKPAAIIGSLDQMKALAQAVRDSSSAWFSGYRRIASLFT